MFRKGLDVKFIDGDNWVLDEPLWWASHDDKTWIEVPKGFVTDFASIPRVLWTVVGDPAGPWAPAAVIHDMLYRIPGLATRARADAIFRDAMADVNVGRVKRHLMWLALRMAGWKAYQSSPDA